MGCLKRLGKMIIFIALLFAFFAYGGYAFVKEKYDGYTRPERAVLIEEEKDFGDLSKVSADFALSRSLNFFGYRKINAVYLPDNQKISIFDLNSNDLITMKDFESGNLELKLEELSSKFVNSAIMPISDVKITSKGKVKTLNGVSVPYADFKAKLKFVPIVGVKGTIVLYSTQNKEGAIEKIKSKFQKNNGMSAKLVVATKFPSGFKEKTVRKFVSQIKI